MDQMFWREKKNGYSILGRGFIFNENLFGIHYCETARHNNRRQQTSKIKKLFLYITY